MASVLRLAYTEAGEVYVIAAQYNPNKNIIKKSFTFLLIPTSTGAKYTKRP